MKNSLVSMGEFLNQVRIPIRLASRTFTGWPSVVSLWFLHQDNLLYCATQSSAKIVSYLKHDHRCAFEIAADQPPYCGVRGQARASIDEELGLPILEKLLVRYTGDLNNNLARTLLANSENEVAIILEPLRIYTWDFSDRMKDVPPAPAPEKVCP